MTVEEIIKESISTAKLAHAKARREEIYKLLDYYSGSETSKYIEKYLQKVSVIKAGETTTSFLILLVK